MQNTPLALNTTYCRYKSTVADLATLQTEYLLIHYIRGPKHSPNPEATSKFQMSEG